MSADAETPWWATEDPAGHQTGEGSAHGEHVRPAWLDAVEAIDGAVRAATKNARQRATGPADSGPGGPVDGDGPASGAGGIGGDGGGAGGPGGGVPGDHKHGAIDAYCHVCPVCALLRALEETRPDVLVHLTEAAKHLTLAAKAVVDSQADRATGAAGDDFESIPVDD